MIRKKIAHFIYDIFSLGVVIIHKCHVSDIQDDNTVIPTDFFMKHTVV